MPELCWTSRTCCGRRPGLCWKDIVLNVIDCVLMLASRHLDFGVIIELGADFWVCLG